MVRAGLRAELSRAVSAGRVQAIVCDAQTDADLAAIAAASVGLPVYWVGSAGLAAHLPDAAGIEGRARLPDVGVAGPILVVVGSLSAVSRRQALSLEAGAALASFVASPRILRAGAPDPRWQALRDSVSQALLAGGDVMIRIEGEGGGELAQGQVLCDSLARLLAPSASGVGALIATGGETARSVLSALGVNGLQMLREIEPGVPLSWRWARDRWPWSPRRAPSARRPRCSAPTRNSRASAAAAPAPEDWKGNHRCIAR